MDVREQDIIYLAGLLDGVVSIEVNVSPHQNYAIGYRFEPKIRIGLNEDDTAVLGLIDEYCDENNVKYTVEERSDSDSIRVLIQTVCDVDNFLDQVGVYMIRERENAEIMVEDIIPAVKDDKHKTKEGFYDLMKYVEQLRAKSGRGRDPKYTREYFAEEWDLSE